MADDAKQDRKDEVAHGSRIEEYAMIGDCQTGALVAANGSIDWLCWPDFSSGACFAALLGNRDHGHWQITLDAKVERASRAYLPHTMILETRFGTAAGEVSVTDFMPACPPEARGIHSSVVRTVQGLRGTVAMLMDLTIRFDYGRTVPWVTKVEEEWRAVAGPDMVVLRTQSSGASRPQLEGEGESTVSRFTVDAGESVTFILTYASSIGALPEVLDWEEERTRTEAYWQTWAARSTYRGEFADEVERSLMTLKAMTFQPSGGMVAALTSSLPEMIGGTRNWDYRYCWLRDTAFTLMVLMYAGYTEEAVSWRRWLLRAVAGAPDQVQTIYGINGERQLTEWTIDWLPGYEASSPVRVGNGAVDQFQLDVFGEVAGALANTPREEDDIGVSASSLQAAITNHLCKVWPEPDMGIWEVRGEKQHFTYSKVMAWVALDRAIRQSKRYTGGKPDIERWIKNRDLLHKEICEKGFSKKLNSFTQFYGSEELDASCLRIVLVGFLPPDDSRIRGTVQAIENRLMSNGLLLRYDTKTSHDGLPAGEGAFLACSFWLVNNLALIGRRDDALALFRRLLALRNDVGLLAEEYDPHAKRMLGNFPQALSHIALIHAAMTLAGRWSPGHVFEDEPRNVQPEG